MIGEVLPNLKGNLISSNEVKCVGVKVFGQLNINSCIKQVNLGDEVLDGRN